MMVVVTRMDRERDGLCIYQEEKENDGSLIEWMEDENNNGRELSFIM